MTITITGPQVKRGVQSAEAVPVVEAPGFVFYDKKSPTSSSADFTENDTYWCFDMEVEPSKTYILNKNESSDGFWGARTWFFDAAGTPTRTINLKDTNYCFTTTATEVRARVGSGYSQNFVYDKTYRVENATLGDIDFDLSKRYYSSGNHSLVVKAKADGKEDSDYSNTVTYTV